MVSDNDADVYLKTHKDWVKRDFMREKYDRKGKL